MHEQAGWTVLLHCKYIHEQPYGLVYQFST